MKSVLSLLMSVYVLLLSVMPCTDEQPLLRSTNGPTQLTTDHPRHNSTADSGDHCSPLCTCACCGTVLSQPPVFSFTFVSPLPMLPMRPAGSVPTLPSVTLSTWQPPQLS